MLTSELAINWRRGDKIVPLFIKTDNAGYLRDAEILIEIFCEFKGKTRGELEHELEEYVGAGTDYRILRGFMKLLTDRAEFDISSIAEPSEIRQKLFLEARKFQPVLPDSEKRNKVLESIAKEFETNPELLLSSVYADLFQQQKLISFDSIEPENLLERYNLAQAQALLYKCVEMKIKIAASDAENYRSIFGWIKHFGLIHTAQGNPTNGYEVTLTGAASLFHRSQKYGIQMAVFLPALLLCKVWKMSAEVIQKEGGNAFYELSSEQAELKSYYSDVPEYKNSDIDTLKRNWDKSNVIWQLNENKEVVDLGKMAFIPDFVLISLEGDKVYLDVLGFWTPKSLEKRLAEFKAVNFRNFIFAAGQELRGSREEPLWESKNVLFYKTKIVPQVLEEIAKKLIGFYL
jgi:predicted nuclease of restriction endonuclease-like RecB superfamily